MLSLELGSARLLFKNVKPVPKHDKKTMRKTKLCVITNAAVAVAPRLDRGNFHSSESAR